MKTKLFLSLLPLAALGLALTACNDDDYTYEVGEPAPEGSVSPYFPSTVASYYAFSPLDKPVITIPVERVKADQAVTFPLSFTTEAEGFQFPGEVAFEAGQTEAEITVDCSALPHKVECAFTVTFPAEQLNPYVEGYTQLDITAIMSEWTLYADDVDAYLDGNLAVTGDIYMLEGSRQFMFKNFLNSTIDVVLNLPAAYTEPWGVGLGNCYALVPIKNFDAETEPGWWYICNDDATEDNDIEGWPTWSYDGVSTPLINYLSVMDDASYSYIYPYYTFADTGVHAGWLEAWVWLTLDDGSSKGAYTDFYFTPKFNPLPGETN